MKKVLIIGGGFVGLAAAVFLAEKKFKVTLLESSPSLGGRAKSFYSPKLQTNVDNGQHLLMGCYDGTLKFLEKIGATENFERFRKINVPFLEKGGRQTYLNVRSFLYPFNLASALFRFNAVPASKRFKIFIPFFSLLSINESFADNLNAWLSSLKQDPVLQKAFWNILSIGALNAPPEKSDVKIFKNVLSKMFLSGNKGFEFIIPSKPLTEAYALPAKKFIENNGGEIFLSERAVSVKTQRGKITEVITTKRKLKEFDAVISSVPFRQAKKIFGENFLPEIEDSISYSPILNLHIGLKNNPLNCKFAALIDSKIHWVFNHGSYITLVTSAAFELIEKSKEEISETLLAELQNYIPLFYNDLVTGIEITKEKEATFVPSAKFEKLRKKIKSPFKNLLLAGDWTHPGLPATIESAVLSGFSAGRNALEKF